MISNVPLAKDGANVIFSEKKMK
uniref:50S ribosomal protein L23 n=1 Tax=Heterorhabditis bacteriophora TaxID=37862 RepID=A0A1I7X2Z8_HETBA